MPNVAPYRIILAEAHGLFRQAVKGILAQMSDLEVVGEVGDGSELFRLLNLGKFAPHMVILDISMPRLQGIGAIRQIKTVNTDTKVLVLSLDWDREYVDQAISNGADGYLLKQDLGEELFPAIERIRAGGIYFSTFSPQR